MEASPGPRPQAKLVRETILPTAGPRSGYLGLRLTILAVIVASLLLARGLVDLRENSWAPPEHRETARATSMPELARDSELGRSVSATTLATSEPGRLRGVASTSGPFGVLAAWTEHTVYASFDDGRSFAPALAAEGAIDAVTVDGRGWVYALRDRQLFGIMKSPGVTSWRQLPYASETYALTATAGYVAWLHQAPSADDARQGLLAITIDGGASFYDQLAPHIGDHNNRLRVEANGDIDLVTIDRDHAGNEVVRQFTGHVDGRPFYECSEPTRTHEVATDQLGRAILVSGDRVLRRSPRHGWRELLKL